MWENRKNNDSRYDTCKRQNIDANDSRYREEREETCHGRAPPRVESAVCTEPALGTAWALARRRGLSGPNPPTAVLYSSRSSMKLVETLLENTPIRICYSFMTYIFSAQDFVSQTVKLWALQALPLFLTTLEDDHGRGRGKDAGRDAGAPLLTSVWTLLCPPPDVIYVRVYEGTHTHRCAGALRPTAKSSHTDFRPRAMFVLEAMTDDSASSFSVSVGYMCRKDDQNINKQMNNAVLEGTLKTISKET